MDEIWAIILAAGESKRMGSPKMLLPFAGITIIEKVVENVLSSNVDKTLLVLGSDAAEIRRIINSYPVMHCYNEDYKNGMLSSVKCGICNLPQGFRAAMIMLGDQPMIGSYVIDAIIKAYNQSGKGLVVPVCGNKRGHPLLTGNKYRKEIVDLDGPEGLKELLKRHPDDLFETEINDPSILRDIDTFEEYRNELNN